VPLSRAFCAPATKLTTNLVGLAVVPNASEVLTGLYKQVNPPEVARRLALSQPRTASPDAAGVP